MFSKTCQYALQAMLYLAVQGSKGKNVGLKDIASDQDIPLHFLSKIMQQLVRAKLIGSVKGPNGGFFFIKPPQKITLMEIVKKVDGLDVFERCCLGLKKCSDKTPCPVHYDYKIVREGVKKFLTEKSLTEMSEEVLEGKSIVNFC